MDRRLLFALLACIGFALTGCPGAVKKAPVEEEESVAKDDDDSDESAKKDDDEDSADEDSADEDGDDDDSADEKAAGDDDGDSPSGDNKIAGLKKGCDDGVAAACNDLGFAYDKGNGGLEADKKKALALYKTACKGKNKFGCNNTGIYLERGFAGDIDLAGAVPKYQKACDLGHAWGCANAGRMHYKGLGTKKDAAKGFNYWDLSCKKNNPTACNNIAWYKCKDEKACGGDEEKLSRRAVASQPKNASFHDTLGFVLCERKKKGEANKAYQKACDLGFKEDCGVKCDKKTRTRRTKRKSVIKYRRATPSASDRFRAEEKRRKGR